jgi:hypothetical protein
MNRKLILRQLRRTGCPAAQKIFAAEIRLLKPPATLGVSLVRRWQAWFDDLVAVHRAQDVHSKMTDQFLRSVARRAIVISSAECGAKRL